MSRLNLPTQGANNNIGQPSLRHEKRLDEPQVRCRTCRKVAHGSSRAHAVAIQGSQEADAWKGRCSSARNAAASIVAPNTSACNAQYHDHLARRSATSLKLREAVLMSERITSMCFSCNHQHEGVHKRHACDATCSTPWPSLPRSSGCTSMLVPSQQSTCEHRASGQRGASHSL